MSRKTIEVICCPTCSSTNVGRVDWRATSTIATWRCRDCGHRWREPISVGREHKKANIP